MVRGSDNVTTRARRRARGVRVTAVAGLLLSVACGRRDRTAQPSASAELTFDAVQRGRACKRFEIEGQAPTSCEFRVGQGLRIVVAGVGGPGASFTVEKSDADGDYYVTAGGFADHRCAIIKPGRANSASPIDYAFISARTGQVYRDWQACDAAE